MQPGLHVCLGVLAPVVLVRPACSSVLRCVIRPPLYAVLSSCVSMPYWLDASRPWRAPPRRRVPHLKQRDACFYRRRCRRLCVCAPPSRWCSLAFALFVLLPFAVCTEASFARLRVMLLLEAEQIWLIISVSCAPPFELKPPAAV